MVFARTRPADDQGPGIAVFLVPADPPGVEVGAKDAKMGQEGAWTADVSFTDVRVGSGALDRRQRRHRLPSGDDLVGARPGPHRRPGGGRRRNARLTNRSSYAATATQGGTPIGNFQLVQAMIADQQTGVLAGRALVRDAARLWVTGEDRRIAPSAAKLFCTEMAGNVADLAVQIHGGSGYMRGVAGRTHLPRCAPAAAVRGHQRDPATDHRVEPRQGGTAMTGAAPWPTPAEEQMSGQA